MNLKPSSTAASVRRVRPPDRRAHLIEAAAAAFAAHGFHGTRMSDIAGGADVSAPALYRHFTTKSALLGAVVRESAERMQTALASVESTPDDPANELGEVIDAYVATVLNHRSDRDLYRWESGALDSEDRTYAQDVRSSAEQRVRDLILAVRPELSCSEAETLTEAVYSTANSPSNHRVTLPRKTIGTLIGHAARTVAFAELPPSREGPVTTGLAPTARREVILTESVALFAKHGFHEVTIEQIGAATGLPPSGVYRHFPSKQAILAAALQRASERTASAVAAGLAQTDSPSEALTHLVHQYALLCVTDPAIITVYRRCFGAIDGTQRGELRRQQRINVDEWASWLRATRPELPPASARFLVHAALDVMNDLTGGPHAVGADTGAALALTILLETPAG
ncbi:MAG: TetR/AcrR family transcriptional regulator [Gordonia sp. (in: high G+C Gram-positive bacteria)]|uniref:TetR/AcrR family transcriptional regulator n=1 Tax=Gordonia sp. (in: high G+C Gram-positive bacteria) TaxID=84139 RepID=UPI003BB7628A